MDELLRMTQTKGGKEEGGKGVKKGELRWRHAGFLKARRENESGERKQNMDGRREGGLGERETVEQRKAAYCSIITRFSTRMQPDLKF